MKIVFIVQYHFFGGTFFRWHNLAIALQQQGHTVMVFSATGNPKAKLEETIIDGIAYHIVPGNHGSRFFGNAASNPITAIQRLWVHYPKADVYHIFQPFLSGAWAWQLLKWKYPSAKFIYDWDDLWIGGLMHKKRSKIWDFTMVNKLEQNLPRKAHAVTVCSHFLQAKAIERGAKKVAVLHNGIWPATSVIPVIKSREILGLDTKAFYIGFMGKTQQEIAWCFEVLQRCGREDLRLALCGTDTTCMEGLSSDCLAKIDYLGQLTPEESFHFANAIDIGLLPLSDDPFNQSRFPIKFAEYQKAGTPVAFSDVGELKVYNQLLPWNINCGIGRETFVDRLTTYLNQKHTPQQVSFKVLMENLSWEKIGKQLATLYTETAQKA